MKNKIFIFLLLVSLVSINLNAAETDKRKNTLQKTYINDQNDYIAINQILMWFANNGMGSYNVIAGTSGLYWPGGKNAVITAIFEDGLIFGGKVGTEIRVGGSTYRYGLQAGSIVGGKAGDPSDSRYRIYKIKKGWESLPLGPERDRMQKDYNEWPGDLGAPYIDVNNNGTWDAGVDQPEFLGDEVNWMVLNDLDASRTTFLYGTQPIGLEIQCTVFGFNRTGPLGDMVFKKYKIINKGPNTVRDMVLSYWSDPDLGYANDDYAGCDTTLSLGYVWNGDNKDEGYYETPPPASGYDFFQGPIIPYDPVKYPIILEKGLPDSAKFGGKWIKGKTNLPLTSFAMYINGSSIYRDPTLGSPIGSIEMYNYQNSKIWDGSYFIDPNTSQPVNFCLAGDPVAKTGWFEGLGWPGGPAPDDRRIVLSSGKFIMNPNDTQEVVVAVLVAKGSDNINSVKALKSVSKAAQVAYDLNFKLTPPPPQPKLTGSGYENKIVLQWEENAESYNEKDVLIYGNPNAKDPFYRFEGYEIYQYRDLSGKDPILLATYDKANGIKKVLDWTEVQGEQVLLPSANGTDGGLYRTFEVNVDKYSQKALFNGSPYYFGIVSYGVAYDSLSAPKVLKSTHNPIEIRPQTISIDRSYTYNYGDYIKTNHDAGKSDGVILVKVYNPEQLTGDKYEVTISDTAGGLHWNLKNVTKNSWVLTKQKRFLQQVDLSSDGLLDSLKKEKKITDGFIVAVADPGASTSKVREVSMIKDGGVDIKPSGEVVKFVNRIGTNVFSKSSARGWWFASLSGSFVSSMQNLNSGNIGEDDFEIRFGTDSSSYYTGILTGAPLGYNLFNKNNPKGKSKTPVKFYNIGNMNDPNDDKGQLYIKVNDRTKANASDNPVIDSLWTGRFVNVQKTVQDTAMFDAWYFQTPQYGPVPSVYPDTSEKANNDKFPVVNLSLCAKSLDSKDLPTPGTVIRILTWKQLKKDDKYSFSATKPAINDNAIAKENINKISVFPNPYFGANALERDKYQRFVRFTNLPPVATIRIYSIAGIHIRTINKNSSSQFEDWDLRNAEGLPVASGMFIAYIELPGVGNKILKIAVIQEKQYIDKL